MESQNQRSHTNKIRFILDVKKCLDMKRRGRKNIYRNVGKIMHENKYKHQHKTEYKTPYQHKVKRKFVKIPAEAQLAARNTSIFAYVASRGLPLEQRSHDAYRIAGTKIEISKRKNIFSDWSSTPKNNRKPTGGIVNFVMYMEDVDYVEAVQRVLEIDGAGTLDLTHFKSEPFEMPQIFSENFEKAKTYLTQKRKIDPFLVESLHQAGLIKQTRNGEVGFIWAKGAEDIGLTLQGTEKIQFVETIFETVNENTGKNAYPWLIKKTGQKTGCLARGLSQTREEAQCAVKEAKQKQRQYDKRIWRNSGNGEGHGFNFCQGNRLKKEAYAVVTFQESAIDCLSYQELFGGNYPEARVVYQSLEGRKESIAYNSLKRFEEKYKKKADLVILALDNDEAGNETSKKLKETLEKQGYRVQRHVPEQGKDWNEQLQMQKSLERIKQPLGHQMYPKQSIRQKSSLSLQ